MFRFVALLLVAAAAATATACGGAKPAAKPRSSGVYGTVTRGPLKPVCERGVKCYEPAKSAPLAFRRSGKIFARVQTNAAGSYRITLPPGSYIVGSKLGVGGVRPTRVRVLEGKFVHLNLVVDTGIR